MNVDLRLTVGMLFVMLAALLIGYGLWATGTGPARDFGFNVNLIWGLVMGSFGAIMWIAARRPKRD